MVLLFCLVGGFTYEVNIFAALQYMETSRERAARSTLNQIHCYTVGNSASTQHPGSNYE